MKEDFVSSTSLQKFFRKGKVGEGKKILNEKQIKIFYEKFSDILNMYNY